MDCEECLKTVAELICKECEESLCSDCDSRLHKGGKRKFHIRRPLCQCGNSGQNVCLNCSKATCSQCQYHHAGHILDSLQSPPLTAVFWDVSSCRPKSTEDISRTLSELSSIDHIGSVRAYGSPSLRNMFSLFNIPVISRPGLHETHALILDLSVAASEGNTQALVISAEASQIRPHLLQLSSSLSHFHILVSARLYPLEPLSVESLPDLSDSHIDGCPLYQVFAICPSVDPLVKFLKKQAAKGVIAFELPSITREIAKKEPLFDFDTGLKEGERLGVFHLQDKKFGPLSLSLKLDQISLEGLLWTLRSLKTDEMMPTERAIQSRMKEAFDFKPSAEQWANLIRASQKYTGDVSLDLSYPSQRNHLPEFSFRKYNDLTSETLLIFPKGEEWEGIDQYIGEEDVLNVKQSKEWEDFTKFMDSYFSNEDSKGIAGGRYGCAQFVQACGTASLKDLSLGKLSYMVQLAVNGDCLRYQKTLLVWKSSINKPKTNLRLRKIKQMIVDILKESSGGVSLAQLPLQIRKRLGYHLDVPSLGFAKLKDLLVTMEDVHIQNKGMNNPTALLRRASNKWRSSRKNVSVDLDDLSTSHSKASSNLSEASKAGVIDFERKSADFQFPMHKKDRKTLSMTHVNKP